jgi:hypothetical protein
MKFKRLRRKLPEVLGVISGDWRSENLFPLKQTHALWQPHQQLMAECDQQIAALLPAFDARVAVRTAPLPPAKSSHQHAQRHEPQFAALEECCPWRGGPDAPSPMNTIGGSLACD